ncbi:hypothetical protein V6N13_106851 [Hibiscus sabdariffa]
MPLEEERMIKKGHAEVDHVVETDVSAMDVDMGSYILTFHKNDVHKAFNLDKKSKATSRDLSHVMNVNGSSGGKVDFRVVVKPTLASGNPNLVKQHNEAGVREGWI